MCQILEASVIRDTRGKARLVRVRLSTGEEVAFTFSEVSVPGGPCGLFGRLERLVPLAPSMYDECLFGSGIGERGCIVELP